MNSVYKPNQPRYSRFLIILYNLWKNNSTNNTTQFPLIIKYVNEYRRKFWKGSCQTGYYNYFYKGTGIGKEYSRGLEPSPVMISYAAGRI